MTRRLRKTLMVGAVLISLLSLIGLRLDADRLNANVSAQLSQYSESTLQAESASLSFMHGIGVRLDQVSIDHPDCQIQAKHINISMRLIPLLLGKTEIDSLDVHDAVFKLKSDAMHVNAKTISSLPVERINLIRSRIEAADGTELLNDMRLELRGIGSEHETLWELNAQQDRQALSAHGRILFHEGDIESSFGKLKLTNMPVSKIRTFAPASLMGWIEGEGNTLSGSLTMDMTGQQTWAVFGSMLLKNEATTLAATLRGKLSHPSKGQLIWKDSFIHLNDEAVIAIAGACEQDDCSTSLDAKNIALARWQPFIPKAITFHHNVSGLTDLTAALQWDAKTWRGKAALTLKQASFMHADQSIAFPDLGLNITELSGSAKTWLAQATITSPGVNGMIHVQSKQEATGKKHVEVETQDTDSKLWQPLANLLLSSLDLPPTLQAEGNIQGTLHLHQAGQNKTLTWDIDATAAQLNSPWFKKEAGVTAVCKATMQLAGSTMHSINMSNCQLNTSRVAKLNWSQKKAKYTLTVQALDLNLEQLKAHAITFPENVNTLGGVLKGSGKVTWTDKSPWIDNIHGDWELRNIGTERWHANGDVRANKSVLSSKHLRMDGAFGQVELKGSYNVAKQRGNIDISSGKVDWSSFPTLNSFWQQVSLRGNIKQTEITLLQNNWRDMRSSYKFAQGDLTLQKLKGNIAGGSISSDKLLLSPQANGLNIQGNIRGKKIQLDQLHGLSAWLQADLRGSLHANIKLHGSMSHADMKSWQHSNGDVLIYSGDWQQQVKAESLTERLGIKAPELKTYAFRTLEFRFRMHADKTAISGIQLLRHDQTYRGKASISADFHMRGHTQHTTDKSRYVIDGILPQITWTLQ